MEFVTQIIDDNGFYPQYGMAVDKNKGVEVACIMEPESCYPWLVSKFAEPDVEEAVFAIDRARDASPRSVGLTYDDFLTIVVFNRGKGVVVGVCEYVPKTKQMMPIDWNNVIWNGIIKQEFYNAREMIKRRAMERGL